MTHPSLESRPLSLHPAYQYAATLVLEGRKSTSEIIDILVNQNFNNEDVSLLVNTLQQENTRLIKKQARKEALYGLLWFVIGTIATIAHANTLLGAALLITGIHFWKAFEHLRLLM